MPKAFLPLDQAAGISAALALALAVLVPLPAQAESDPSWAGYYAGLHLGYGAGQDEITEINGPRRYFPDTDGVFGGAQAGRRWQWDRIVVGADLAAGSLGQSGDTTLTDASGGFAADAELGAYGALTAQFGYAVRPTTLVYARAGLALAALDAQTVETCAAPCTTSPVVARTDDVTLGWTLGAGVEQAFGAQWSGFVEYQYFRFRTELALPATGAGWDHELDLHALRLGVNWHF